MTPSLQGKRLLSVAECAEYIDCHPDTVRRHLNAGTIPYMKFGRAFRISRQVLDDLIENQAKLPTPPKALRNPSAREG